MVPATTTQEYDFRPHHKRCRVCMKPIYVGDIAYKTTLHAPQLSTTGLVHYWTCRGCQAALDDVLTTASKKVGAA